MVGNTIWALACDHEGRIWAGLQSKGVAVFNGKEWRNYDALSGPLGERVHSIATAPDGTVWMATSLGLSRYSEPTRQWNYFTRSNGLPSDQILSLAFNARGALFAATACDGITFSAAAGKWQTIGGPPTLPLQPRGVGLPTSQINAVLVARCGTVFAATTTGLAWSLDGGVHWEFLRGADYAAKVQGLALPPKGWKKPTKESLKELLPEDYITCLAEDDTGHVWVGFRKKGIVVLDPRAPTNILQRISLDVSPQGKRPEPVMVQCLLADGAGGMFIGTYGHGLWRAQPAGQVLSTTASVIKQPPKQQVLPPLPAPAQPSKLEDLQKTVDRLEAAPEVPVRAAYLGEDWNTHGDWAGYYGNQGNELFAACAAFSQSFQWNNKYQFRSVIGPHHKTNDLLRGWIHWAKTRNTEALFNPRLAYRRQAEWDDHGEAYPLTHEGPDIWTQVVVPAGIHRLSLYFFNKDGESGNNRFRDYLLELRSGTTNAICALDQPVLAKCRVRNFKGGGVYERFIVRGPGVYAFHLSRNYSFNTIVSGVFADKLVGKLEIDETGALPCMGGVDVGGRQAALGLEQWISAGGTLTPADVQSRQALERVNALWSNQLALPWQLPLRVWLCRAAAAEGASAAVCAKIRAELPLWTAEDRMLYAGQIAMAIKANEHFVALQKQRQLAANHP